jgi:hypothetical protein
MWRKWRAANLFCSQKFIFADDLYSKRFVFRAFQSRFRAEKSSPQSFPLVGVSVTCFPGSDAVKFLNQSNKYPAVKTSVNAFVPASYGKIPGGKKDATEKDDSVRG